MKKYCLLLAALAIAGCDPVQFPADIRLPDGAVYDGEIENNLFHGEGSLTWPDGRQYEGQFHRGADGLDRGALWIVKAVSTKGPLTTACCTVKAASSVKR